MLPSGSRWGPLEIRGSLGRGSFGERYHAFDTILRREVTLELGYPGEATPEGLIERARRFAQLRHPGIVAVHRVETHDGRTGAWFDWVPGVGLREAFAGVGQLEPESVAGLGFDLCRILHAIHGAGLAHGGLSPESLVVTPDRQVFLVDMGVVGVSGEDLRRAQSDDLRRVEEILALLGGTEILASARESEAHSPTPGALGSRLAAAAGIAPPEDLRALRELPANIVRASTSFVGRDRERRELRRRLLSERVCTIRGAGGSGKTRLAFEVCEEMRAAFPGLLAWVDISVASSPESLGAEALHRAGLRPDPPRPDAEVLSEKIGATESLLVLDNCEHLKDACAQLVAFLLSRCPRLRILATSRQRLGVEGEWVLPLGSLALPSEDESEPAARSEALRLFLARAKGGGAWSPAALETAVRICRLADGLPLAIELAAARTGALPLQEIADRLQESFDLLRARGSRPSRVATIRASIEWSYELLDAEEQTLFRRLAVLHGSWSEGAAVAVAADESAALTIRGRPVADLLVGLVEKSLLERVEAVSGPRYRYLDMILRFARDRLGESGERAAFEARHFQYHAAEIERHGLQVYGAEVAQHLDAMAEMMPNVVAALRYAATPAVGSSAAHRAAFYASRSLGLLGRRAEEWTLSRIVLSKDDEPSPARAALLAIHVEVGVVLGELEAAASAGRTALELFRQLSIPLGIAMAVLALAMVALARGDLDEARQLAMEGLEVRRAEGDEIGVAAALSFLGVVAARAERYEEAADWYRTALSSAESTGHVHMIVRAHANLAATYRDLGDLARALDEVRAAHADSRAANLAEEVSNAERIEGGILRRMGDLAGARRNLTRAFQLHVAERHRLLLEEALLELALLEQAEGRDSQAAAILGAAERLSDATPGAPLAPRHPWLRAELETMVERLRARMGPLRWATDRAAGRDAGWEQIEAMVRSTQGVLETREPDGRQVG